jgi:hypothetical protein
MIAKITPKSLNMIAKITILAIMFRLWCHFGYDA